MQVRDLCWTRNAVFLEPRWNMDQQVQKVLWSGRLPKVFWFTSEKKYVWYQCGAFAFLSGLSASGKLTIASAAFWIARHPGVVTMGCPKPDLG